MWENLKIFPSKSDSTNQTWVSYRLKILPDTTYTFKNEACYLASFCWTTGNYIGLLLHDEKGFIVKHFECCKIKCSIRLHVHNPATSPFIKDHFDSPVRTFWGLEKWKMLFSVPSLTEGTDNQAPHLTMYTLRIASYLQQKLVTTFFSLQRELFRVKVPGVGFFCTNILKFISMHVQRYFLNNLFQLSFMKHVMTIYYMQVIVLSTLCTLFYVTLTSSM